MGGNKAVSAGMTAFFAMFVQRIFRGQIVPTIIGAAIGASLGYQAWRINEALMPACAFFGLVIGAGIAAGIFPRSQQSPPDDESETQEGIDISVTGSDA